MPRELLDRQPGAVFAPKLFGLTCCYCDQRSVVPCGERVYVCVNPDCPGQQHQDLGQFVSMLTVDAHAGAQLRPWEEVVARDRARRLNPRATLLTNLGRSVDQGEREPTRGEARATSGQIHASAGESPRESALPRP